MKKTMTMILLTSFTLLLILQTIDAFSAHDTENSLENGVKSEEDGFEVKRGDCRDINKVCTDNSQCCTGICSDKGYYKSPFSNKYSYCKGMNL